MEWQPIETAPKDGTRILIYDPNGYGCTVNVCYWGYAYGVDRPAAHSRRKEKDWYEAGGDNHETYEPTHWMPLPAPPHKERA